jgi:hypothetical protein
MTGAPISVEEVVRFVKTHCNHYELRSDKSGYDVSIAPLNPQGLLRASQDELDAEIVRWTEHIERTLRVERLQ